MCETDLQKKGQNRQPKEWRETSKIRKSVEMVEKKRKQAKRCENDRGAFCWSFWLAISSDHIVMAMQGFPVPSDRKH